MKQKLGIRENMSDDKGTGLPVSETDVYRPKEERIPEETPTLDELAETNVTSRRIQRYTSDFEVPENVTPLPLKQNSQGVFLFNICHKGQRPKSLYPGFRVLGVFPDMTTAADFCNTHYPDSGETVFASPLHQLIPICDTDTHQGDEVYCRELVNTIVDLHTEEIKSREKEFEENISDQKTGEIGDSIEAKRKKTSKEREKNSRVKAVESKFKDTVKDMRKATQQVTGDKTIANQKFLVIVTLLDIQRAALRGNKELQPTFAVVYAGSDEKTCEIYAKYTATKAYKDCTVDVVPMYEWLFPENVDEEELGKEAYGNDKLNQIMDARKQNNRKIETYKEWFKKSKEVEQSMTVELDPVGDMPRPKE